ncbi:MAG: hypothetical protein IJ515_04540 [Clostridia bacterium]|nr:hypothetical protein [Clostridia bacterium]
MYTRTYYQGDERINVPENYDGCAFTDGVEGNMGRTNIQPAVAEPKISPTDMPPTSESPDEEKDEAEEASAGVFSFLTKLPFKNFLGDKLGFLPRLENFKVGTEELLIGALALFLLFSKDGDKECAIILLLALFIA